MKESVKTSGAIAKSIASSLRSMVWPETYHIVRSAEELPQIVDEVRSTGTLIFDCETTGLNPWRDRVLGLGISNGEQCYSIAIEHLMLPCVDVQPIARVLGSLFIDPDIRRINHNIKFDAHLLREQMGMECGEFYCDTLIQSQVLNPDTETSHGLKDLAEMNGCVDYSTGSFTTQFGKTAWSHLDPKVAAFYLCRDVDLILPLMNAQNKRLEAKPKLKRLFWQLEMPVLNITYEMEKGGILIDEEYIRTTMRPKVYTQYAEATEAMAPYIEPHLAAVKAESVEAVLQSPKKLGEVFFDRLDIPLIKFVTLRRDKITGEWIKRSLDKEAVEGLQDEHECMRLLGKWRKVSTLKKLFVDQLPGMIVDGRIHATIRSCGTSTGRMSMSSPNLQQVSTRDGPLIRNMFIPAPGNTFMSADFSQQEMRIQAHFTKDPALIRIFTESLFDMYSQMAIDVFGCDPAEFKDPDKAKKHPMRRITKAIVLALGYGMRESKFARNAKIPLKEAKRLFATYHRMYPGVDAYAKRSIKFAKDHGYIVTLMGRERPLPHINNTQDAGRRMTAERAAQNQPIQGTAADATKIATLRVHRLIKKNQWPVRIVLLIHDEIVYEMPTLWAKKNPEAIREIISTMENALPLCVPMKSSATFESRWGTEYEIDDLEADILDSLVA